MTERQRLQYLSSLFPFQAGIPGSNKTRRLRRKRIQFMESWIAATKIGLRSQLLIPRLESKTLLIKELNSVGLGEAFLALRKCYDGSASTRVKLEKETTT